MFALKSLRNTQTYLLISIFVALTDASKVTAEPFHWTEQYIAPGHEKFHHWYQYIQKQLGVTGCCDDLSRDCGPVESFVDNGASIVKVLLEDGKWHYVGSETMIFYVDTPDGKAHACRQPRFDWEKQIALETFTFYCLFLPIPALY